nr:MAG TPA: hypothetical protein [Caudoviricetes sp.]
MFEKELNSVNRCNIPRRSFLLGILFFNLK